MPTNLWEKVVTDDGSVSLVHPKYDEMFHSKSGALSEARNLYITGSGFAEHINSSAEDTWVLDIGLGLGYNALSTIEATCSGYPATTVHLISLEKDEEVLKAFMDPQAPWKANWSKKWQDYSTEFHQIASGHWQTMIYSAVDFSSPLVIWDILHMDATDLINPEKNSSSNLFQNQRFNFFWQDAFSPPKNPELWSSAWFDRLHALARPGARLMTYSVSRQVKDALTGSEWSWELIASTGRKKHWLRGTC